MVTQDSSTLVSILAHVLGIFVSFIGALVIYLITYDATVKTHAAKALNWQLSLLIYAAISAILVLFLIGLVFLLILTILNIVFCIIAAIKASENKAWDYPFAIKFLK